MKLGRYFAGAALFVLPFIFSATGIGEDIREPKARFLAVMFGAWIGSELWRKTHLSLGCACIFLFASLFATTVEFPLYQALAMLGAFGSCLWVAQATKDDIKKGLEILELSGVAVAFYALVCQLQGKSYFITLLPNAIPMGVFGQQTLYGPFAAACFASALFSGRHYRAFLLFLPIPIINSSFTFLSVASVLALYAFWRMGKYAILLGLIGIASLGIGAKLRPDLAGAALDHNGRFYVWEQTLELANRHWLLGHGFASFRIIYPIFQEPELRHLNGIDESKLSLRSREFMELAYFVRRSSGIFLHPHSEPLSVYFEFGAIGVLIAMCWVASFVWYWFGLRFEQEAWALGAVFVSVAANAIGNFPFHLIPQVLLPLWAFVAMTVLAKGDTLKA